MTVLSTVLISLTTGAFALAALEIAGPNYLICGNPACDCDECAGKQSPCDCDVCGCELEEEEVEDYE